MQKITPFLWFDDNAEEAVNFYTSIFKDSKIGTITRNTDAAPGPKGAVLVITFELNGQKLYAMNGGPAFKFNEAISLFVNCDTQDEIDYYWEKLSAGGEKSQCGWLKDKFGLSWQVAPALLIKLLSDKDETKAGKVMQAMMKMSKIDIKSFQDAYNS